MSKIMKNFICANAAIMLMLVGIALIPAPALAEGGKNYKYGNFDTRYSEPTPPKPVNNPRPVIRTLSPNAGNRGAGHETVTITGTGFVPGSVAKVNGMTRPTTYIDNSHLLVQVNLDEPYRTEGGFYVTVWNAAPGGGHSNGAFFKLEGALPTPLGADPTYGYGYNPAPDSNPYGGDVRDTSLASSVILGGPTFLPSSLVQWVFVAILTLLIIILVRRVFGHREEYDTTPLKHA